MNGWIKLHRQFLEWEWYSDQNVKAVFIHCLLMANLEDNQWRGQLIKRGSFISSIGKVAIDTGLSVKAVRIALEKLKKTSEILTNGASQWTMITVCKYETYQTNDTQLGRAKGKLNGEPRANEGQTKGEPRATTKEYKNKEEGEEGKKSIAADKSAALYSRFIDLYNSFILEINNAPAKMDSVQGSFAKKIIAYLKKACIKKDPASGDDEILRSWEIILSGYDRWDFYQGKIRLQDIYTNLENIINLLKNGKSNNRVGKQPATSFEEIDRIADYIYGNQPVPQSTTSND